MKPESMDKLMENIEITRSTILYILKQLGGTADFHKIFKILFFADKKHLARFGSTITDDNYIAMVYGPVPSNAFDVLKALRGEGFMIDKKDLFTPYFELKGKYKVKALKEPDMDDISTSEKVAIDDAISECKDLNFNELKEISHGYAWNNANGGDIKITDMAKEENVSEDMLKYIEDVRENNKSILI